MSEEPPNAVVDQASSKKFSKKSGRVNEDNQEKSLAQMQSAEGLPATAMLNEEMMEQPEETEMEGARGGAGGRQKSFKKSSKKSSKKSTSKEGRGAGA